MNTTHTGQGPPARNTTAADQEWTGHAMARLDNAQVLLDDIEDVIDAVEPRGREHAADLLDAAIEHLTRLRKRLPPAEPEPTVFDPPF